MNLFRAWTSLLWLSLRRMVWSINALMVMLPLTGGLLFVLRRDFEQMADSAMAFRAYSDFLIYVFASFLVPICAIAFGATSIGGDREDRTLVFLLVRPVPRPLLLLAKYVASLPLTAVLVIGSFGAYCWFAGTAGREAFVLYLPAILLMTLAYVSLFHFLAVSFRYATMIALVYAVFFELVLGNMPGIIKRLAINYYGRSMIYAAGEPYGLPAPDVRRFEPLAAPTAMWVLLGISAGFLVLAILVFQRREYHDLT